MKCVRLSDPCPHRFLTESDALAFIESKATRADLIVPVFEKVNGKVRRRQQWLDAPFELMLLGEVGDDDPCPVNFEFHECPK